MTQRRELLMEYEQFEKPQKVWLGDGRSVEAIEKGNIQFTMYFKMRQSKNVTMYNALYVPKLTCNLFSVRATAARGNSVSFGDTQCVVCDRHGKLLGNGSLIECLYYLNCDTPVPEEKVTILTGCQMENKIDLWHRQTGHLNESQLKEFQSYLMSKGIHHELTAPYSPAQNGTAERINRTLMESARTMMTQAGLPDKYWAEAVATAVYLRNCVLTRSLSERMTPYEKWYGRKPDLSHLKVFGCMAYAYIPDIHRNGKLSKKAEKLRFVGYSLQTKGYRLINEDTGRVVISRDVIFNESDFLFKPMAVGTGGRLPVSSDSVLNDDQDVSEQDMEGQEEL